MREFFGYKLGMWFSRCFGELQEVSPAQFDHLLDEKRQEAEHQAKFRAFKRYAAKYNRFSWRTQEMTSSKLYAKYNEWMGQFPFRQEHFDAFVKRR